MRTHIRRYATLALLPVLAATALIAGCGGDSGSSGSPASAPKAAGGQRTIAVAMKDSVFEPKDMTAAVGETITFDLTNNGPSLHNMHFLSDDVQPKNAMAQPFEAGKKAQLVVKFTKPGTYKFQCDLHTPDMVGTVTVK